MDILKKKTPLSNVPGEKTSYYQKVFDLPEPFSNQYFKGEEDITNISEESFQYVKNKINPIEIISADLILFFITKLSKIQIRNVIDKIKINGNIIS